MDQDQMNTLTCPSPLALRRNLADSHETPERNFTTGSKLSVHEMLRAKNTLKLYKQVTNGLNNKRIAEFMQ